MLIGWNFWTCKKISSASNNSDAEYYQNHYNNRKTLSIVSCVFHGYIIAEFQYQYNNSGRRTKNGGVQGEEIFCPRAVRVFCPPPQAASNKSSQVSFR
jgi:hypothetical protein